jgi:lactate permease
MFNFSGMPDSLARGFATIGPWFIIVAPILGWIGVASSGRNTSTNAMFGAVQASVSKLLGFSIVAAAQP